jgi:hypothetical protein
MMTSTAPARDPPASNHNEARHERDLPGGSQPRCGQQAPVPALLQLGWGHVRRRGAGCREGDLLVVLHRHPEAHGRLRFPVDDAVDAGPTATAPAHEAATSRARAPVLRGTPPSAGHFDPPSNCPSTLLQRQGPRASSGCAHDNDATTHHCSVGAWHRWPSGMPAADEAAETGMTWIVAAQVPDATGPVTSRPACFVTQSGGIG